MFLKLSHLLRKPTVCIVVILLAGWVAYSNTFHVPFVLDDTRSITGNEAIQDLARFFRYRAEHNYMPNRFVVYLTFALNHYFGGLDVFGYHVVNLAVHLATAILVFFLLRLTLRTPYFNPGVGSRSGGDRSGPEAAAGNTRLSMSSDKVKEENRRSAYLAWLPLTAALLFVSHPVQTQAVTYIVQRVTSLATLFYVLSLVLYIWGRILVEKIGPGSGKLRKYFIPATLIAAAVFSAVLSMKTKEISFTLPIAAGLYELYFFKGNWKRRLICYLPLLATLPIVPATVFFSADSAGVTLASSVEHLQVGSKISRIAYLVTQFPVLVTYLRLLVFPVDQNLDYDFPVLTQFFTAQVVLSFVLLLCVFGLGVFLFWRTRNATVAQRVPFDNHRSSLENYVTGGEHPRDETPAADTATETTDELPFQAVLCGRLISFGIIWFFLTISVESSLIPIRDVIMEHRLYLPGVGAAISFSAAFHLFIGRFFVQGTGKILTVSIILLVLVLAGATWRRNYIWGDDIRLWQDVAAKSPNKGRAHNNLAVAYENAGQRQEAFEEFRRAIKVDPDYYMSYYNLAELYVVSGQPRSALPLLQSAIMMNPEFTEAYVMVGAALMRGGQFRQVVTFLERNLDRVKYQAEARYYLGAAYAFLGNREAALRELEIVSQLDASWSEDLKRLLN